MILYGINGSVGTKAEPESKVGEIIDLDKLGNKCMYAKDHYTEEDRKVLCKDCEEDCDRKKEEPSKVSSYVTSYVTSEVSEVWHDASTPPYDKNADRDIYIVTRNQNNRLETWHIFSYMTWKWVEEHADGKVVYWAYLKDILDLTHSVTKISDQEPVNESLEEAAGKYGANVTHPQYYTKNGAPVGIGEELSDAVIYGANWQKKQTIRKSCEWLRENIYQRVYKEGDSLGFPTAVFLEDFRKAMEE